MNPQFGQSFAGLKFEIANREIAFGRGWIIRSERDIRDERRQEKGKDSEHWIHVETEVLNTELSSRAKSRDLVVLPIGFATGFFDSASLRSE